MLFGDWVTSISASEIGLPLADPKFAIRVRAQEARRQTQGCYEAVTLRGDIRIHQGTFTATAEEAVFWIDLSLPESAYRNQARKFLLDLKGNCEIKIEGQTVRDDQWTGRLFSYFEADLQSDVWLEPVGPPPSLSWNYPSTNAAVEPAVSWTSDDEAMHVRLAQQVLQTVPPSPPSTGILVGNPSLGGTVVDPGPMTIQGERLPQPNNKSEEISAFQLGAPPVAAPLSTVPAPIAAPVVMGAPGLPAPRRVGARTFQFAGRSGVSPQFEAKSRPDRGDSVITFTGGVRLRFGDTSIATSSGVLDLGTVLIESDRVVIWTADLTRLMSGQINDLPVEIYLEGNVVFQQGSRRVYAERMFYNVQSEYGMILSAEVHTDAPQYDGIIRMKADVVQQLSRENFVAQQAAITSSRLGVPRYWLQADRVELTDRSSEPKTNLFGFTTSTVAETGMKARARNNFVYLEGLPVFYWPIMDTNVDTSNFYLSGLKYRNDQIFGNQVMVDWDLYQLLGIRGLDGTRWTLSTDYLSKRGFALGTQYQYNVPNAIHGGPANGFVDAWGLRDEGLDILGSDRINLLPEELTRGRLLLRHRHYLTPDTELWGEVGWISDRNFLEQYFEQEWDTQKDMATALRLRQYLDNKMLDLSGQVRINDFHTETTWLPRLDHYWLGQTLGEHFTYYSHSDVGYARQRVASTPLNAADAAKFTLQPHEVNASGVQASTRHELSLPIDTGWTKIVPYISGEAAYWGEDINGNDLARLTGQAGWRTSTPIWGLFPNVQNSVLNLNGLAHKLSFESQFLYADTNKDLDLLPLYDPIDDNSQEHFRRRLVTNTFGGVLPPQFDSTEFAARQSLQRYVSAVSNEIVTDQLQSRVGIHQRWQTKRGALGKERIADVVEFDVDAILFGDRKRDNFGETIGAINYDFRYHIGDRVTLISDGFYDLFESGLMATTIGGVISRPGRGEAYVGVTSLEGPISSTILTTAANYRMNEKWLAVGGASFDFGEVGNIGQSIAVTRIGESFLLRVGAAIDYGRDNVSFQFALEPRFFQRRGLGIAGGQAVASAGYYGLE